ncbi:MAG: tetratricopeptide repeat protein [Bacteroidales bacterium]
MIDMIKRCSVTLIALLSLFSTVKLEAQQNGNKFTEHYNNGVELYNKALFQAADLEFDYALRQISEDNSILRSESEGYKILIAIELMRPNLDALVLGYEASFPYSSQLENIYLKYASYHFNGNSFDKALEILNKIERDNLTKEQRTEYDFKLGYTHMRMGNLERALSQFDRVTKGIYTSYTNPGLYYSAYIYYMKKDFVKAIELFSRIEKDPRFSTLAQFYMLESNFMLKNFDTVIENGDKVYELVAQEFKTKTARMVSEAYFFGNNTEKAKYYFEKYSLTSGELSRKDIYYQGIISYKLKNYNSAIESLNQVTAIKDSLSQNAQYHIGQCYVELKNKQVALNAFKAASEGDFDQLIREDAMFNYAKLSFDLNSDISKFQQYLKDYSPPELKFNEIQNYIASYYLLSQDYKSAVETLTKIKRPTGRDLQNLQKASFLRGMQLVNLGGYRDAIPYFELSITNSGFNSYLKNIAKFWLAEALYRDNQFQESIDINLYLATKDEKFQLTPEYSASIYNLAYGYFKISNFRQAQEWFKRYLATPRGEAIYANEARLRLGDCLFMQRDYSGAVEIFSQIPDKDPLINTYAKYQMAISYGLLGEDSKKIEALKEIVETHLKTKYYPEVLYEMGRTLVQTGDNNGAMQYFQELSTDYRESHYYTKALLEMGLVSINQQENGKAIGFYKRILEESPLSPEAQSAIAGLENIYMEKGNSEEFLAYLDQLGLSKVKNTDDKELMIFNSAEKQYLSGNYSAAISSLTTFINRHPNGTKISQAYFYLGESYLKTGKPELALDAYLRVMEKGEGSFSELATLNYARISYQLENYQQALKGYSTLSMIAALDNNKIEAQIGKMNSFFMERQYENALAESQRAGNFNLSEANKLRVKYVMAKSYYLLGERSSALPILKELAKNKISPEGAESAYLLISNTFDNGDFASVEKDVFSFSDSNTPQTYWLAKSFILLGDSYAERENWEQAEATFKSIQNSYKPKTKDDIAEQIKLRLSKIENRAK